MRTFWTRLSTFAVTTLVPAMALANSDHFGRDGSVAAPELDPGSAATALALALAGTLYLRRTRNES